MTDYSALADDLNDGAGEEQSSNDYDDDELSNAPILNVTPTVALGFDEVLDIDIMGGIKKEQNILGGGDGQNSYGNDIVVTLKNPSVEEGDLYAADQEKGADYKLVNIDNHEKTEENVQKNGDDFEVTGIRVYGRSFDSHEVDDFDEDAIVSNFADNADVDSQEDSTKVVRLMVGSWCGLRLAQIFDCRGGISAYYSGDEKTTGLVEYPPEYGNDDYNPSEDDSYPRIARSPTMRDDLQGQEGVLFFYMGDGGMHKVDVFAGEASVENKVSIIDDGKEPEYPPYLVWDTPDEDGDGGSESSSEDSDTSEDSEESDVDLSALESADDDEDGSEVTYGDLSEEQQAFVDRLAESDNINVEEADVSHLYTQFAEDNGLEPMDAGDIERIVVNAA